MNKGGFSWSKLLGVSQVKSNVSRKIGFPLTKSGRNQKIGRTISKGCFGMLAVIVLPVIVIVYFLF